MTATPEGWAPPSEGGVCVFESRRGRHVTVVQRKGTALRTRERKLDAGSNPAGDANAAEGRAQLRIIGGRVRGSNPPGGTHARLVIW